MYTEYEQITNKRLHMVSVVENLKGHAFFVINRPNHVLFHCQYGNIRKIQTQFGYTKCVPLCLFADFDTVKVFNCDTVYDGRGVNISTVHTCFKVIFKEPTLTVLLSYTAAGDPVITGVRRVSKPGLRVYTGAKEIPSVRNGFGVSVLSTPLGLMGNREARRRNVGGELLCEVW